MPTPSRLIFSSVDYRARHTDTKHCIRFSHAGVIIVSKSIVACISFTFPFYFQLLTPTLVISYAYAAHSQDQLSKLASRYCLSGYCHPPYLYRKGYRQPHREHDSLRRKNMLAAWNSINRVNRRLWRIQRNG
jgi:hypothetical protein